MSEHSFPVFHSWFCSFCCSAHWWETSWRWTSRYNGSDEWTLQGLFWFYCGVMLAHSASKHLSFFTSQSSLSFSLCPDSGFHMKFLSSVRITLQWLLSLLDPHMFWPLLSPLTYCISAHSIRISSSVMFLPSLSPHPASHFLINILIPD